MLKKPRIFRDLSTVQVVTVALAVRFSIKIDEIDTFSRRVNQLYHKSFRFATFLLEFSRWIDVFRSTAAFRPSLVPYKSGLSGCGPAAAAIRNRVKKFVKSFTKSDRRVEKC
jgi:hypothetical protein